MIILPRRVASLFLLNAICWGLFHNVSDGIKHAHRRRVKPLFSDVPAVIDSEQVVFFIDFDWPIMTTHTASFSGVGFIESAA